MHELTITRSMLDLVLEQAAKSEARRVGKINLVVGELCGYVEESVRFYFDFLGKGTIAEGADLRFQMVPAVARCRNCAREFNIKDFDWLCPGCGRSELEIIGGKELQVESIEVD